MQLDFATTTIPTILLWGLGLALFAIGGFIGYLNFNMDARKKIDTADSQIKAAHTEAERRIKEAEAKLAEAKQLSLQMPAINNTTSLLRVHTNDNRVLVEMDGKTLSGVITADEKKRLIDLISYVRPFLEGKPVTTSTPPAQPMPVSVPQPEIKPVPVTLFPSTTAKKVETEKPFASLSIVQQIDSILQTKLAGTSLEGLKIRLQESLQGAVEVYVGLQKYEAIDDVKDEAIKKIIRTSIAEWEEKYAPGKK